MLAALGGGPLNHIVVSKKNFIDGLESVFTDVSETAFQEDSPFFSYQAKSNIDPNTMISTGNSVSDDDEDDYDDEIEEEKKQTPKKSPTGKSPRKPLTGLDLLIRNTTAEGGGLNQPRANQRKVSLVLDKQLLTKLKMIARLENTNFRLMISDMLTLFVNRYEKDKGPIDLENK